MPEYITLDDPIQIDPGPTVFRVSVLTIECYPAMQITIGLQEFNTGEDDFVLTGKSKTITITGDVAQTLVRQLNTVDLTSNSLEKRLISYCQSNEYLGAGIIGGTPDAP